MMLQRWIAPKPKGAVPPSGGAPLVAVLGTARHFSAKARSVKRARWRPARYMVVLVGGLLAIWGTTLGYLATAQPQYTSHFSLILPGAGSSTTVNLNRFGQASSYANSAFANGSISPTETYKRLIVADRILTGAAQAENVTLQDLGRPRIRLVDQTNLIHVELSAGAPQAAQSRARALLRAFFDEIEALRQDEIVQRQAGGEDAIADYVTSVGATRGAISQLRAQSGLISAEQFRQRVAAVDTLADRLRRVSADRAAQAAKVADLESALQISATQGAATLKLFADEEYRVLLTDLSRAASAFHLARAQFGPQHPQRLSARAEEEAARNAVLNRAMQATGFDRSAVTGLDRAPDGARAELLAQLVRENATLQALNRETAALAAQHEQDLAELRAQESVASELEDRQRDFEVAEAVFASAIARAQSAKTDVYASYPLVQVLEDPSLPHRPSSPKTKLVLAAALAASLMLFVAAFLGWYRKHLIDRIVNRPGAPKAAA